MSTKIITAFLIGMAIGSSTLFIFITPKIAQLQAEAIRIEAFSDCVENKIIGIGNYEELLFTDVLNCYQLIK